MAGLLLPPQYQFVDANGVPYTGGFLRTYVPNTFTPKVTYQNANETTANSNPIVLDTRGTCVVFGDGDFRLILSDQFGNQIFDLVTTEPLPADAISAAMLPVVGASTLAQARTLMGIDAEIDAAIGNINLMTGPTGFTGPTGPTGQIGSTGPTGPGNVPQSSRGNPAYWFDPTTGYLVQFGSGTTDGTGAAVITFSKPFTQVLSIVCQPTGGGINLGSGYTEAVSNTAFGVFWVDTGNHSAVPGVNFYFVANGFV